MAKGFGSRGMGGMGGGNMNSMIRQAQKMQQEMLKAQEELEGKSYEATAGGGVVTAVVSGKRELTGVTIDPEAVDPDDVEMLQDLIVAAVNEAMRKATDDASSQMSRLTGGLNLPFGPGQRQFVHLKRTKRRPHAWGLRFLFEDGGGQPLLAEDSDAPAASLSCGACFQGPVA